MSWFRAKRMSAAEWAAFQDKYGAWSGEAGIDPDLAPSAIETSAQGGVTVTIPFERSGIVETFSPGGWFDRRDTGSPGRGHGPTRERAGATEMAGAA